MRDPMPLLAAIFVLVIAAIAYAADRWAIAVYALSFWHYLVYALAFFWRTITLQRFKRDSFLLKTLSTTMLVLVLWTTMPGPVSMIVIAAGFALNIASVRALGADRTYYGYELEALPPKRITAFPYSMTGHPMLIGNMLAFGGTLLDADFREAWWPLGLLHVALNLLVILMEAKGGENRKNGWLCALSGLALAAALLVVGFLDAPLHALAAIAAGLAFGMVVIRRHA